MHGLDQNWLNDGTKGFMPGDDPDARVISESEYLRVLVASPTYLLAMKLHSAWIDRDLDDAAHLFNEVGFATADQARDLLQNRIVSYQGRVAAARSSSASRRSCGRSNEARLRASASPSRR